MQLSQPPITLQDCLTLNLLIEKGEGAHVLLVLPFMLCKRLSIHAYVPDIHASCCHHWPVGLDSTTQTYDWVPVTADNTSNTQRPSDACDTSSTAAAMVSGTSVMLLVCVASCTYTTLNPPNLSHMIDHCKRAQSRLFDLQTYMKLSSMDHIQTRI